MDSEGGHAVRELGGVLRSTRESLGLDLDEIESRTKIRKRYLVALEEGDWNVLPGRVYARGFVRSYAEILGLDGAELLQSYVDGRNPEEEPDSTPQQNSEGVLPERSPIGETGKPAEKQEAIQEDPRLPRKPETAHVPKGDPPIFSTGSKSKLPVPVRKPGGPLIQTAVIVAALVVIGGGYIALRHHAHSSAQANTGSVQVTGNAGGSVSNSLTGASSLANHSSTGATNAASNTATDNTTPVGSVKPAVVITPQPLQNGMRTYQVKNVPNLDVVLNVNQGQLWLSSKADGKVVNGNDTVNPGQSRTYQAKQSVLLYLGHVQGIQITVNGKTLPLPKVQNPVNIQIVKQSG